MCGEQDGLWYIGGGQQHINNGKVVENQNIIFLREVIDPYEPALISCKKEVVLYGSVSGSKTRVKFLLNDPDPYETGKKRFM